MFYLYRDYEKKIYFDNVCNMSCIYCWDGFSSKIQQENVKFGRFEKAGIVIDNRAKKVDNIDLLTDRSNDLKTRLKADVQELGKTN